MGYSYWSDDAFQARQDYRHSIGQTAFTYDAYVRATGQARVHTEMDPFGVTRESRDSVEHPNQPGKITGKGSNESRDRRLERSGKCRTKFVLGRKFRECLHLIR